LDDELWVNDKVEVRSGTWVGSFGKVVDIADGVAKISIETGDIIQLPLQELRKHFSVGDFINVTTGTQEGKSGWVVGFVRGDGEVTFTETGSLTEV
jgi:transcription elongation factor